MSADAGTIWVFHSGALGDHVLIWPLLRAMLRCERRVVLVSRASHGRLCEHVLGGPDAQVQMRDIEHRVFTQLWRQTPERLDVLDADASDVVTFLTDDDAAGGSVWMENARRAFPQAHLVYAGPPGSKSRAAAWKRWGVDGHGVLPRRQQSRSGVAMFVGAGGASKTLPLEFWMALADVMIDRSPRLIAGPVEHEQWPTCGLKAFERRGGLIIDDLVKLAEALHSAEVYVGCDTGPTHLAAQLGVPTVAVFGPTDPAVWAPAGPAVDVLAPARPRDMGWVSVEQVCAAVRRSTMGHGRDRER